VSALPRLKVLLPTDAAGQSEVSITLVSADGSLLAEAKSTLVVAAAPSAAAVLRAGPPPQPPARVEAPPLPPASGPKLSPDARERALRLVKKGDEQLAEGGIAQARLLYERAAEAGLALGAMALAATYDPVELQHLGALGLKPDHEAARRWYERARQLGAPEAELRLRRLHAN
jgi:TPR repeat protein